MDSQTDIYMACCSYDDNNTRTYTNSQSSVSVCVFARVYNTNTTITHIQSTTTHRGVHDLLIIQRINIISNTSNSRRSTWPVVPQVRCGRLVPPARPRSGRGPHHCLPRPTSRSSWEGGEGAPPPDPSHWRGRVRVCIVRYTTSILYHTYIAADSRTLEEKNNRDSW